MKSSVSFVDLDLLSDYKDGFIGVKMVVECKVGGKMFKDIFIGKLVMDWLMDCLIMVDCWEIIEIVFLFVEYDFMEVV